jgi:hypothetical protein
MGKLIDLTGQRFGKLIVISREGLDKHGNARWNCKCDCGRESIATSHSLTTGHKKSCSNSCIRAIDLTGQRFGKLIVVQRGEKKGSGAYWLCQCDCGNKVEVRTDNLRKGDTTSCGCKNKLAFGESSMRWVYNLYKYSFAKKRNLSFELTMEQFKEITQKNCFYCDEEPRNFFSGKSSHRNGGYTYNGLDRKDNNQGYTLDNAVPCCGKCNKMKSDLTFQEFVDRIIKISKKFT